MSVLNEQIRQTIINDCENSRKREKVRHFLRIGGTVGFCLALTGALGCLSVTMIKDSEVKQIQLQEAAKKPLVYDGGQLDGCNIRYIRTAHLVSDSFYKEDVFLKSECDGVSSITPITKSRVKRNINFSRMKLLNEDASVVNKPKS